LINQNTFKYTIRIKRKPHHTAPKNKLNTPTIIFGKLAVTAWKCRLQDALHYRRPIEHLILVDMSMQLLNIPALKGRDRLNNKTKKETSQKKPSKNYFSLLLVIYDLFTLVIASRRIKRTSFTLYLCTPNKD
jgi:hypothetical protein